MWMQGTTTTRWSPSPRGRKIGDQGPLGPFFVPGTKGPFPDNIKYLGPQNPHRPVEQQKPYPVDSTFPKRERLKSKKVIEQLFAQGRQLGGFPLKLIYLKTGPGDGVPFKVAVVAPKKRFRTAVARNRIKRLLREAYRHNKPLLFNNIEGNFAFLFLYLGPGHPPLGQLDRAMKDLMAAFLKKESHEENPQ